MASSEERIATLVGAARAHKLVVGGARDITRLLGVLYACTHLNLAEEDTEGYDARDSQGLRVQIKSRAKSRAPEVGHHVNPVGTVGRFTNFKFDYAVLVTMNGDYELDELWRAEPSDLEALQSRVRNPAGGIRVADFFRVGSKLV